MNAIFVNYTLSICTILQPAIVPIIIHKCPYGTSQSDGNLMFCLKTKVMADFQPLYMQKTKSLVLKTIFDELTINYQAR
jgi:hypothetical protein